MEWKREREERTKLLNSTNFMQSYELHFYLISTFDSIPPHSFFYSSNFFASHSLRVYHFQKTIEINKHAAAKMSNSDKANSHQQSAMIQNYHNNHMDYRSGSQMSFYDNQQQYQCTDDELHRQHYFAADRQQTDTMHSSSDASSKSEKQMPSKIYHQQNGFLMKSKKPTTNNNDCELMQKLSDDHVPQRKPKQMNSQYGKILNSSNKLTGKDHRNGTRPPIPMLPSPPSTPPPPLNAKIKDYHESSNKFYQLNMHLSNQQQNRFNGNGNGNINNNNEVTHTSNHAIILFQMGFNITAKARFLILDTHFVIFSSLFYSSTF